MAKPSAVVVVGDGWAALAGVGFLIQHQIAVTWITGSRARLFPPLYSLEGGIGVGIWTQLCAQFGIECGDPQIGGFTHQYRNKAFRDPIWSKVTSDEERRQIQKETLWGPEQQFVRVSEARFDCSVRELEERLRAKISDGQIENLTCLPGIPVQSIEIEEGRVNAVILGSGERILCHRLLYADQWKLLPSIEGLPRPLSFLRKREPTGLLQVAFHHDPPLGADLSKSASNFFLPLSREPGQEIDRHLWGYLSEAGSKSLWSLCLSSEEIEDNHEISKKLKRLKNSLDKVFEGFFQSIASEQVRFEEEGFYGDPEALDQPAVLAGVEGAFFLTDGYGLTNALQQVKETLRLVFLNSDPKSEDVNLVETSFV